MRRGKSGGKGERLEAKWEPKYDMKTSIKSLVWTQRAVKTSNLGSSGWAVKTVLSENRPQWKLSSVETVLSENCPQWKLSSVETVLSGNCPQWKLSSVKTVLSEICPQWKLSSVKTVLSENCPQAEPWKLSNLGSSCYRLVHRLCYRLVL